MMVSNKYSEYLDENPMKWKEFFIFLCVIPFTEYEFSDPIGNLINPDHLKNISVSHASSNILIGMFSENIELEVCKQEIPRARFSDNLQEILSTDIFSNTFSHNERSRFINKLFGLGFRNDHILVEDVDTNLESEYESNLKNFLFKPISRFIATFLNVDIKIRKENSVGRTGVYTRVPNQTTDLLHTHPDIVVFSKATHNRSLAVVEVKRIPILKGDKKLELDNAQIKSFVIQLIAEMFFNRTNKGMLTDSYTTILFEIDIERALEVVTSSNMTPTISKSLPLNYKVLDCHSSGLTLRGSLVSFLYEAFKADKTQLDEMKKNMDTLYTYVRKTDEEYLTYLDNIACDERQSYRNYCQDNIENLHVDEPEIYLGSFKDIEIQSGFTFNSLLFKVQIEDMKDYIHEKVNSNEQLLVKVFDPVKAKREHGKYVLKHPHLISNCKRAYSFEKRAYELLQQDCKFNSVYIKQDNVFGWFNIDGHYHAMGPFIALKYKDTKVNPLPIDKETYEKARQQLEIIHQSGITHADINKRNILFQDGKVHFIDFGYSKYNEKEKRSRSGTANEERCNAEQRELCEVFGQPVPEAYRSQS